MDRRISVALAFLCVVIILVGVLALLEASLLLKLSPPAHAQSPFDCDPIYEDAERADTPAERQALAQLYIACMVRENWR